MRADYCPIGGEPCQSLCAEPCSARKSVDPAVVKQLVEALQSTEMFLDYIYNQKNKPNSFNLLMQQIIIVEQALAAAKETGL